MCKNFSRQNNIDQYIIALKKRSNKADKKYQNEFSNLNELYESNSNFCLSVESESKSNGIKKMKNTMFNLKKTDETKNMPTPILNYAELIDRARSPTLDVLTSDATIADLSRDNYEKLSEQFEKLEKIVDQNHMLQLEKESVRIKIDLSNQDAIIKAIREVSAENKVLFISMESAVYHISKYDKTDAKDYLFEANNLITSGKPIFNSENNFITIEFYKFLNEKTVSSCFVLVKNAEIFLLTYIPIKKISSKELEKKKMEINDQLEKIIICLKIIKVKWLNEPNDESSLQFDYEFGKASIGMDLFVTFCELGYALYKKNIRSYKHFECPEEKRLIKEIAELILETRDWLEDFVPFYRGFYIGYNIVEPVDCVICETRSGIQFMIELFQSYDKEIDYLFEEMKPELAIFDSRVKYEKNDLNLSKYLPDDFPKTHEWWFD
ncbi:unnamed protein product [Brachionus calyciflorus]|uniref:Uncharacterized protein n=1 Tax=Brachionus calyciflorus TaxID=104777 RepID=A0A813R5V6_9BILA|nr:unnamed protein product [Brachionus calyciflorus]